MATPFVLGTVGTHAQGQTLYKKPLYNSMTDFTPVALLAEVPIILIVRKDLPVKNFAEFVAYAQKNQNKMQFGSAGAGSATHLGCVLLNHLLKTDINHIPYKGTGPAMIDLAAGRIDFLCEIITTAKPHVDGGTVQALAIFDKDRSPALPDLATAIEQGSPKDLIAYTWNAIFLPRNAPADVVSQLNSAAVDAMKAPKVRTNSQASAPRSRRPSRDDAAISRRPGEERDREMGGPDQGVRRHHRVIAADIRKSAAWPGSVSGHFFGGQALGPR